MLLLFRWHRVSIDDLGYYCSDSESLLDGCTYGDPGGLCGISVQWDISNTFADRRSSTVGFEA